MSSGNGSANAGAAPASPVAVVVDAPASQDISALAKVNQLLPLPVTASVIVPSLVAGASARILASILTAPLDALKARRQFTQKVAEVKQFESTGETARSMLTKEGPRSFYRGLPARLIYVGPAAAISFLFYEEFRVMFHREHKSAGSLILSMWPLCVAAGFRVMGTTIRTPFDVIRQRMQVMGGLTAFTDEESVKKQKKLPRGVYRNTFHAMMSVARHEGPRALFSGVGATILRDIPFSVVYFLAYESIKTLQQWVRGGTFEDSKLTAGNHMSAGAVAAACAVLVSNPLDVIKTRLQTQGSLAGERYTGVLDCARLIRKEEGMRGFLKGLGPRVLYLAPSAALTFAIYEKLKVVVAEMYGVDATLLTKRKGAPAAPSKTSDSGAAGKS